MPSLNLKTREGELELAFTFKANREFENKCRMRFGREITTPDFVQSVISSRVVTEYMLIMLECCLRKHHPKLKGGKLEQVVENFLDRHKGGIAAICVPILQSIQESKMFHVEETGDGEDKNKGESEYESVPEEETPERIAEVMGEPGDEIPEAPEEGPTT